MSERTRELQRINRDLHREIAERRQVEEKLSWKNEQLRRISDNLVEGFVYQVIRSPRGDFRRFLYASAGVTSILGIAPKELYADATTMYRRIHPEDVIMRFDREHRHLYVNPAIERLIGFSPEEFVGKTHQEMGFPQDLVQLWDDAIEKVFTTAKPLQIEFQLPEGTWMDWLLMPELDTPEALPLAVIMADSNGLKLVNDTYGHAVGDEMLRAIGEILQEVCADRGVLARWGGDEFVIVLPRTTLAEDVLSHHERWDGTGYPRGLKERSIPLLARITSVVDAYDVMTHGRPYKAPLSQAEALEECRRCSGTQFDPDLVKVFLEMMGLRSDV